MFTLALKLPAASVSAAAVDGASSWPALCPGCNLGQRWLSCIVSVTCLKGRPCDMLLQCPLHTVTVQEVAHAVAAAAQK
jgi:hypothetical protein